MLSTSVNTERRRDDHGQPTSWYHIVSFKRQPECPPGWDPTQWRIATAYQTNARHYQEKGWHMCVARLAEQPPETEWALWVSRDDYASDTLLYIGTPEELQAQVVALLLGSHD